MLLLGARQLSELRGHGSVTLIDEFCQRPKPQSLRQA